MERRFKITVDGREFNVTVEELGQVNSLPHLEPSVIIAPSEPLSLSFAAVNSIARPVPPAPPPPMAARGPAEPGDVVSPLNGVVQAVLVTVGQQVAEGDNVAVVEAMKMKTPLSAGRAGKVASIPVKAGDGVEAGQLLVKIA
jgi:glutaconyl-CoA/methylmalonyl-CoA decarboxylase subunit gamma